MKKLIILILLVPCLVFAGSIQDKHKSVIARQGASGGDVGCLEGETYKFYWDGDYTIGGADTDKACNDSGNGTDDGANTSGAFGAYGESGSVGWRETGADQYVTWTDSGATRIDLDEGTVYIKVYAGADGGSDIAIFEAANGSDQVYVSLEDNESVKFTRRTTSNGGPLFTQTSSSAFSRSTWFTVGISWRVNDGNDLAVNVNGGAWSEEDRDIGAIDADATAIRIGNLLDASGAVTVDIDEFVIVAGWESASPL